MVNYYRCFLPAAARVLKPLTDALRGLPLWQQALEWSTSMQESFTNSKQLLLAAIPLAHPNPVARIVVAADASDTHIGGILQQHEQRGWRPLGFFSRKLTPAELKYAAFDRELLAAFALTHHFQELLKCRSFQLWTDHKPLVAALESAATPKPPRRQRQMAYILEYTTDVVHTPGTSNVVADLLSPPHPPKRHQLH